MYRGWRREPERGNRKIIEKNKYNGRKSRNGEVDREKKREREQRREERNIKV